MRFVRASERRQSNMGALPPILYVDDEEHNLTVFEAAFEDFYDVHTATSARRAIRILRHTGIHLVIADQRMPEMTGVQLLEVVAREFPDMVRMILTGYVDVDAIITTASPATGWCPSPGIAGAGCGSAPSPRV